MKTNMTYILSKWWPAMALAGVILFYACEKEDPNLDLYVVEDLKVAMTSGDSLRSISTISTVSDTEYRIDAVVPDDGNTGKWFRIEFLYPDGITPISVTPSLGDSIDFSIAKTFKIQFTDKVTKNYTVTIVEQAPEAPTITSFSLPGAEQIVVDNDALVVSARMPQGANLTALKPLIEVSPATAFVVDGDRELDFTNNQVIRIKNGAITKNYSVRVTDYGFTKVTQLLNRTLAAGTRPGEFATAPETSLAMEPNGANVYVAYGGGILKYDLSSPNATPVEVNRALSGGGLAANRVLQIANGILFSLNPIWESGTLTLSAWPNGTSDTPVNIARITPPAGSIFQNFHVEYTGSEYKFYVVDRAPLRKSPRQDPILRTFTLSPAQLSAGTTITDFATTETLTGLVAAGVADGANAEFFPIPNSNEFIFNTGAIPPVHLNSAMANPVWISSALVNSSSTGAKFFEFNRGKYLMYGVFSWSTNMANPSASKFVLLDLTKRGMRQTIADITSELANAQYGTWNSIQKMTRPMGGSMGDPGGFYCQTAWGVTPSGKLRVACVSAQNGFAVYECE